MASSPTCTRSSNGGGSGGRQREIISQANDDDASESSSIVFLGTRSPDDSAQQQQQQQPQQPGAPPAEPPPLPDSIRATATTTTKTTAPKPAAASEVPSVVVMKELDPNAPPIAAAISGASQRQPTRTTPPDGASAPPTPKHKSSAATGAAGDAPPSTAPPTKATVGPPEPNRPKGAETREAARRPEAEPSLPPTPFTPRGESAPPLPAAGVDDPPRPSSPEPEPAECWRCSIELVHPYFVEYEHPALSVPVCVQCNEELEAVAVAVEGGSDQPEEECAGCGPSPDGGVDLILCDACPRGYCHGCVARAHGEEGQSDLDDEGAGAGPAPSFAVSRVLAQDAWRCPSCDPPPFLLRLQQEFQDRRPPGDEGESSSVVDDDDDEEAVVPDENATQRKFEMWANQLAECEEELHVVLQGLDALDGIDGLPSCDPRQRSRSSDQDENDRYVLNCRHAALQDKICRLQEDLEGTCGVDLARLYQSMPGQIRPVYDARVARTCPEVVEADRAIDLREEEEELRRDGQEEVERPMVDEYDEIEDLEDLDGKPLARIATVSLGRGWRANKFRPNPEAIRENYEQEDARLEALRIPVRRVTERLDRRATRIEHREEKRRRKPRHGTMASGTLADPKALRQDSVPNERLSHQDQGPPAKGEPSATMESSETAPSSDPQHAATDSPSMKAEPAQDPDDPKDEEAKKLAPRLAGAPAAKVEDKPGKESLLKRAADKTSTGLTGTIDHSLVSSEHEGRVVPFQPLQKRRRTCPFSGPKAFVLNPGAEREVSVTAEISGQLKEHQKEGLQFIWRNSFSDLNGLRVGGAVRGCILAHNMGLGKSLTTIALLHSVFEHPHLVDSRNEKPLFRRAIIVAPKNTLTNWENEVRKWTKNLRTSLLLDNLSDQAPGGRRSALNRWECNGGILLLGEQMFLRIYCDLELRETLVKSADILVLDEAHTMLKNSSNKVYQALSCVETKRRVLLTGTPLTNNVTEYFRMVHFAFPGAIGGITTELQFEREYRLPIELGLPSDASLLLKEESVKAQVRLFNELSTLVHRKCASLLRTEVPHMQQVVLTLRPTKVQTMLCKGYKRLQRDDPDKRNFFRTWTDTKRVHNHPGVLTMPQAYSNNGLTPPTPDDDEDGEDEVESDPSWWVPFVKDREGLKDAENGYKIVVLLHILAYAKAVGDKVLVFSSCLRTLNYIESVLERSNWSTFVSSLDDDSIGAYKKNEDYFRIDGNTQAWERGKIVDDFNDSAGNARLLLISSKAGGVGINLTAANRVVLFDSTFNPTITTQCVYRAYRYGQTKEVFCYRLLTEGTMEMKIYARSVTKQGVSQRVIDRKSISRCFTAKELQDMQELITWVQCERCEKWRVLITQTEEDLPDKWYCEMNDDVENNSCEHAERCQKWYENRMPRDSSDGEPGVPGMLSEIATNPGDEMTEDEKLALVKKDTLLQHILAITQGKKRSAIVSHYEFHEALVDTDDQAKGTSSTASASSPADAKHSSHGGVLPSSSTNTKGTISVSTSTKASDVHEMPKPASPPLASMRGTPSTPKIFTPPTRATPARQAKLTPRQLILASTLDADVQEPSKKKKMDSTQAPDPATAASTPPQPEAICSTSETVENRVSSGIGVGSALSIKVAGAVATEKRKRRRIAPTVIGPAKTRHPLPVDAKVIDLCDSD